MINQASDIKETATSNVANLALRKDGIITHELVEGHFKTNLETLSQELDIFLEWSKIEKKTFLIDTRKFKEFNMNERLFIQNNIKKFSSKYAIIVDKGISLYFYNILNYLTKPPVPTKCFYKVEDAINWLKKP
jgi:hypothetical protein